LIAPEPITASRESGAITALCVSGALFVGTLVSGWVSFPASENLGRRPADVSRLRVGIDPNRADWYEFAQLPGIGESLARKIVAHRESRRATDPAQTAFECPENLLAIRGIGPRTIARLRPFLYFPSLSPRFDSLTSTR
jgi:competence protein ComEA